MKMDWGTAAQWGALLVAFVALIRGELRSQDKDHKQDLKGVEKRFEQAENRIQIIETEVNHLPGKDAVHQLQVSMAKLEGQLAVIAERVNPIKAVADRMQELMLMEGSRK